MKKLLFSLVLLLCCHQHLVAQRCFYTPEDSAFVAGLLKGQHSTTLQFARQFLGRPYVAHTLEKFPDERLVVNTRQLDCTTLVENVVALTLCAQRGERSFSAYLKYLRQLRYRQGLLEGYSSRLHYFTDWIVDNTQMGFVHECQVPQTLFSSVQTVSVNYMSSHPQAYKALAGHPELVSAIKAQERQLTGLKFRFIPKSQVVDNDVIRSAIADGDIIAITCSKPGLDIAHLGFAVWRKDGLHLLNASQLHKKVVEEPMTLGQYLSKHPSHTGIRVIRLNASDSQSRK